MRKLPTEREINTVVDYLEMFNDEKGTIDDPEDILARVPDWLEIIVAMHSEIKRLKDGVK